MNKQAVNPSKINRDEFPCKPLIPRKYQPKGFEILHEDRDIIIGNKSAGVLTVAALWDKVNTVHHALNVYVRKGQLKSRKCVYVVHRLDQATTGLLIFAKTPEVQTYLKENWKNTVKTYLALVHGQLTKKSGEVSSYLMEDEDYVIHSSSNERHGKLAQTQYEVIKEHREYSFLKINLLTGRKNQIRVHMADLGHPIVGDDKYGKPGKKNLALHAWSLEFNHPFTQKRHKITVAPPEFFSRLMDGIPGEFSSAMDS